MRRYTNLRLPLALPLPQILPSHKLCKEDLPRADAVQERFLLSAFQSHWQCPPYSVAKTCATKIHICTMLKS